MITGALSLSADDADGGLAFTFSLFASGGELLFRQAEVKNFLGGYFLHPALPNADDDFYYLNTDEDILILLSGFVYNTAELLCGKHKQGQLSTPCLIASLFIGEGPAFVERLNGDFAIFIYRPEKKEAYLYRDHLGIRPLAWSRTGEVIHFSSDINTLCKVLGEGQPADEEYLLGYFKYSDKRVTPNHNVRKLLPGHYICFSENETKIIRFWHPEQRRLNSRLSVDQMLSELKSLVFNAVEIRCDKRYNAGAHVSGGLDSGLLQRCRGHFIKIRHHFTVSPGHPKNMPLMR